MRPIFLMFDLDDTLYDRSIPLGRALEKILAEEPRNAEKPEEENVGAGRLREAQQIPVWRRMLQTHLRECYQIYARCSQEMFERHERGEVSLEESRILRIQMAVREGIGRFPEIFHREFTREQALRFQENYEQYQREITLSEEVRALLQRVEERGIPMGLMTNGPTLHQKEKIRTLGLDRWIPESRVLVSEQAGCAKPDPKIFRIAERQMKLSEYQVWMIGDSLRGDIAGAAAVEWRTVWLNRDGLQASELPDWTVRTEKELARCVWELVNGI